MVRLEAEHVEELLVRQLRGRGASAQAAPRHGGCEQLRRALPSLSLSASEYSSAQRSSGCVVAPCCCKRGERGRFNAQGGGVPPRRCAHHEELEGAALRDALDALLGGDETPHRGELGSPQCDRCKHNSAADLWELGLTPTRSVLSAQLDRDKAANVSKE